MPYVGQTSGPPAFSASAYGTTRGLAWSRSDLFLIDGAARARDDRMAGKVGHARVQLKDDFDVVTTNSDRAIKCADFWANVAGPDILAVDPDAQELTF